MSSNNIILKQGDIMTNYIVSEEELGKLINTYLVNINVGYVKMYKGKKQTIKDFLESKQPVELVAEGVLDKYHISYIDETFTINFKTGESIKKIADIDDYHNHNIKIYAAQDTKWKSHYLNEYYTQ